MLEFEDDDKIVSVEKKKTRVNSTKQQKLLQQLRQKEKEASIERQSREEDKLIRNTFFKRNENSNSATKKKRKRKNISSKELLSNFSLEDERPQEEEEQPETTSFENLASKNAIEEIFAESFSSESEDEETQSRTSIANEEIVLPTIQNPNPKQKKEPKKPKIPKPKTIKAMKKPSTAKAKNFYTALVWDRLIMHPSLFKDNFDYYNEITKIDLGPFEPVERKRKTDIQINEIDSLSETIHKLSFSGKSERYYLTCITCNKKIENEIAITIWENMFCHKQCVPVDS